jgi:hypothetical protein
VSPALWLALEPNNATPSQAIVAANPKSKIWTEYVVVELSTRVVVVHAVHHVLLEIRKAV